MNIDQALRSIEVAYPDAPDVVAAVLDRVVRPVRPPWWQRPVVAAAAVVLVVIVAVVGLVPAARDELASWLGIRGVTVETVAPPTGSQQPATSSPTTSSQPSAAGGPVASGLGEGLVLGAEVIDVEAAAGFDPLYPSLGRPNRQFVDEQGRAWMLFRARVGLPETAVADVGMIVAQFPFDVPGVTKRIGGEVGSGGAEFVEFGDGVFGLWVPGPHELELLEADGSVVAGRSAGNTLLWEQGELTLRMETALPLDQAIAIAETFR